MIKSKPAVRRSSGTRSRLVPTGRCWCGCGEETAETAFFLPGHDRKAEASLIEEKYDGSLAEMLHAHGLGDHAKHRKAG